MKNHKNQPILYIVIPCYNEQEVLPITAPLFLQKIQQLAGAGSISPDSRILFVNDGSKDKTWEIICDLAKSDPHYLGISQSRNRGHQNAVLAGLTPAPICMSPTTSFCRIWSPPSATNILPWTAGWNC